jgi:c(7)-type cytochrome triheme protein
MIKAKKQCVLWLAGCVLNGAAWSADIAPVGKVQLAPGQTTVPASAAVAPITREPMTTAAATPEPTSASKVVAPASAPAAVQQPPPKPVVAKKPNPGSGANRFNRLLKPPSKRNPPPAKDGIHDPDNDGTHMLQPPKEAFSALPKANSGNRVNWVSALEKGGIDPRFDRIDPDKKPIILDLNIVREVKGSMPDVVYPHKQHTEWLDCSNCHPAIFIPKKGANDISMAAILLGEKCGVCHGKVAFPVAECRKCHSKNKPRKTGNN